MKDFGRNDPEFAASLLRTVDLQALNDKSSTPGINRNHVHQILVGLPSFCEQQEIAESVRACDAKLAVLEREVTALEELFRAMLEELMTGRLRATALGGDGGPGEGDAARL